MPKLKQEHPWTLAALEQLSDGQWHDYKDVIRVASEQVPEDMAFAKADYYRKYHYSRKGTEAPDTRRHGDRTDTVKTGQRFIASKSLQSLARRGKVVFSYDEADSRTRKRPIAVRLGETTTNN